MDSPKNIKAIARPFFRAALLAFEHAKDHMEGDSDKDALQVVLSLDYGVEMLLKAILMHRGDDIISRPKHSISLPEALQKCPDLKYAASVKILRERRDNLQHLAASAQMLEAKELYESTLEFVAEALRSEYDMELPDEYKLWQTTDAEALSVAEVVAPSSELQRDIAVAGQIITWAQGEDQNLAVYYKSDGGEPTRLTPTGEFEYMPVTNGGTIAAYRQSGGIVLYNLNDKSRHVLHEQGFPNSITDTHISAQGISVEQGIGGGIALYSFKSQRWEQISTSGDNSRLTNKHIFWNDHRDGKYAVLYRRLDGGKERVLNSDANWVSPSGELVAFTKSPTSDMKIQVVNLKGDIVYSGGAGIFPYLSDNVVTYLKQEDDRYRLIVADVKTGEILQDEDWVGFPMGRGPILGDDWVYFETKALEEINKIMRINVRRNPYRSE